jgi:hypothetical protein
MATQIFDVRTLVQLAMRKYLEWKFLSVNLRVNDGVNEWVNDAWKPPTEFERTFDVQLLCAVPSRVQHLRVIRTWRGINSLLPIRVWLLCFVFFLSHIYVSYTHRNKYIVRMTICKNNVSRDTHFLFFLTVFKIISQAHRTDELEKLFGFFDPETVLDRWAQSPGVLHGRVHSLGAHISILAFISLLQPCTRIRSRVYITLGVICPRLNAWNKPADDTHNLQGVSLSRYNIIYNSPRYIYMCTHTAERDSSRMNAFVVQI